MTTDDLVVSLTSSDTTEISVPATVTIPSGQTTASFTISAVLDGIADGVQDATVTASATTYNPGSLHLVTTDADLPDLRVTDVSVPVMTVRTGQTVSVSWTVINNGVVPATGSWVDRIYLSTDGQLGDDDVALGTASFTGTLTVGQTYTQTRSITVPDNVGRYYVIAVADGPSSVGEWTGWQRFPYRGFGNKQL